MSLSNIAGIAIVYFGFCLCLAECVWEPELVRRPYQIQVVLIGLVVALTTLFTINVVGVQAPLYAMATGSSMNYPPDAAMMADIHPWLEKYYPVRVLIKNASSHDYMDLNFVLKPDKPIAKISQISGFCKLYFEDAVPVSSDIGVQKPPDTEIQGLSTVLIATDGGYRVRCEKLPANSTIEILAALVNIDEKKLPAPTLWIEDVLRQPVVNKNSGTVINHWFTDSRNPHLASGEVFLSRPIPTFVWMYGTYKCLGRDRGSTEKLPVLDLLADAASKLQTKDQN